MRERKRVGLVAHDAKKQALVDWVGAHRALLARQELWATGTTGRRLAEATGLPITLLKSGPLGGDQQLGAMIAEGRLDVLVFFSDPLSAMPHDVDVKALVRLSTLYDVVLACNRATADFVVSSGLFEQDYEAASVPGDRDLC